MNENILSKKSKEEIKKAIESLTGIEINEKKEVHIEKKIQEICVQKKISIDEFKERISSKSSRDNIKEKFYQ